MNALLIGLLARMCWPAADPGPALYHACILTKPSGEYCETTEALCIEQDLPDGEWVCVFGSVVNTLSSEPAPLPADLHVFNPASADLSGDCVVGVPDFQLFTPQLGSEAVPIGAPGVPVIEP